MAITLGNRIKVSTSTTGTGAITLGSAETGYQTFANGGISNGDEVRFVIEDGTAFEISKGTYTHSGTTLSRTLLESTTGALLNLSGDAKVFVTAAADDLILKDGGTFTGDVSVTGNIAVTGTVDGRDVATDGTKLDGVAIGADVTPSWVPANDPSYLTAHPTITAASSVDNSGRTYIQDITLDANGHVTGITSATETVTNTDTTYSAGSGLSLSSTTFSVNADQRSVITQIGQDTNDYISVGTTNIDFVLDGNTDARIENDGDFHADGNVIAYSTTISDPRLKENIKPVTNGLEKVMQLNGYTFDYKADGVSSAGVMSPEVAKVLPSAIKKSKLKLKMGDDNETEYDVVQYDQLTALLIEAIKDLKAEIEELKNASHN